MQLPTHVARVGAGRLGAKGAAQRRGEAEASERRLLLAGGAKTAAVANAGGKGHGQLEIHCTMVSTSGSRIIHHHECGVGGAVREGCCSCARCACPPEQRTQQRVRRRTGAGRTQTSYSKSYSYTGPVPSVAVKGWTRMRAIVGLADVGGERAQMVVSSWHGVRPDLCARPVKTGAFVPSKFVCAARGRDRREQTSSCKLHCLSVLEYRTSSCGLGGKSGLPFKRQRQRHRGP